jgi:hypothetical protein
VADRPFEDTDQVDGGVAEIGREMADAIDAETEHRKVHGKGASPLHGIAYDPGRGEVYLHRFVDSPVDEEVRKFVSSYSALDAESMAGVRASLTMDDLYTLLAFAKRCAVSALRNGDASARDGLAALTAIDVQRVDWRDVSVAAALLSYSLSDENTSLLEASKRAEPRVGEILQRFVDEPVGSLAPWGYRLVETPDGFVLFEDWGERYKPTIDLTEIALSIAAVLEADVYQVTSIALGSDLPTVWLPSGDQETSALAVDSLVGCVALHGDLRAEEHPSARDQQLTVFLAEAVSREHAEVVASASSVQNDSHEALGLVDERLCCVAIARSYVEGSPAFEGQGALERFRPALAVLLAAAAQK